MIVEEAIGRFLQYGSLADAAAATLSFRLAEELPDELKEDARKSIAEEVEHARLQRRLAQLWGTEGAGDGPYPTFWRGLVSVVDVPFAATCLAVMEEVSTIQFRTVGQHMKRLDAYTGECLVHIAAEEFQHVKRGIHRLKVLGVSETDVLRAAHLVNAITLADPTMELIAAGLNMGSRIPGTRAGRYVYRHVR